MSSTTRYPTIADIGKALETWAPRSLAQSYDNVGLQVGNAGRTVQRALIALDLTPAVIEEAKEHKATLIITHHPLLFNPLRSVTADGFVSSLALRLAEEGIALYSIHTNLDAAPDGVSFALADVLGLQDVRFLDHVEDAVYKLAAIIPATAIDDVRHAVTRAGGTRLSFGMRHDRAEAIEKVKVEVEVPRWDAQRIVKALRTAAGQEVRADIYPVAQPYSGAGLGAIGRLDEPMVLQQFLQRVAERLRAGSLRYAGDPQAEIATVAVCGGSGSSFTHRALAEGVDAYVTADVTYHKFFDVLDASGHPRMALIDAGHYETEAVTERLLSDWLRERYPDVTWHTTRTRTSPMRTFIPSNA